MTRRTLLTALTLLPTVPLLANSQTRTVPFTSNFTMKYIPPGIHDDVYRDVQGYSAKWQLNLPNGKITYHGIATKVKFRDDKLGFEGLTSTYLDLSTMQVNMASCHT